MLAGPPTLSIGGSILLWHNKEIFPGSAQNFLQTQFHFPVRSSIYIKLPSLCGKEQALGLSTPAGSFSEYFL
jgi:hypothetical protein